MPNTANIVQLKEPTTLGRQSGEVFLYPVTLAQAVIGYEGPNNPTITLVENHGTGGNYAQDTQSFTLNQPSAYRLEIEHPKADTLRISSRMYLNGIVSEKINENIENHKTKTFVYSNTGNLVVPEYFDGTSYYYGVLIDSLLNGQGCSGKTFEVVFWFENLVYSGPSRYVFFNSGEGVDDTPRFCICNSVNKYEKKHLIQPFIYARDLETPPDNITPFQVQSASDFYGICVPLNIRDTNVFYSETVKFTYIDNRIFLE